MTENEIKLLNLLRDSDDPEKVAEYMLSLFLDYLHTHSPSQGNTVGDLRELA